MLKAFVSFSLFILFSFVASADGPVVGNARFLEWDAVNVGVEDEFRIYCQLTPRVDVSLPPIATVTAPTVEWAISGLAPGQQFCVVTAFDIETNSESAASNEVPFVVLGPPGNARVR